MPPLQEVPLQKAPSSRTGQVHVEQEVQGPPLQINLQQAQSGIQTMSQILCRVRRVRSMKVMSQEITDGVRGCRRTERMIMTNGLR